MGAYSCGFIAWIAFVSMPIKTVQQHGKRVVSHCSTQLGRSVDELIEFLYKIRISHLVTFIAFVLTVFVSHRNECVQPLIGIVSTLISYSQVDRFNRCCVRLWFCLSINLLHNCLMHKSTLNESLLLNAQNKNYDSTFFCLFISFHLYTLHQRSNIYIYMNLFLI